MFYDLREMTTFQTVWSTGIKETLPVKDPRPVNEPLSKFGARSRSLLPSCGSDTLPAIGNGDRFQLPPACSGESGEWGASKPVSSTFAPSASSTLSWQDVGR